MSTEPFIGEIKIFGFDFPPRGYQLCSGQLMPISQNTALFSLLGTNYGGNGTTTFGLPDMRGRAAKGHGQGPGLLPYYLGETGGNTHVTILPTNMPTHNHPAAGITASIPVASTKGTETSPVGHYLAQAPIDMYATEATTGQYYKPLVVTGNTGPSGTGQALDIQNPYLAVNFSIAIQGIFPSRN